MRKIFSKKTMVCLAVIFALCIGMAGCFRDTKNSEINTINQFSLVNGMPVRIDEGSVYQYNADETWTVVELDGTAAQVFSGENLCVLMEDGGLYYGGATEISEDEEYPLTSAYGIEMIAKALEINKEERFLCINKNIEYLGFRVLLESGEILYQGLEDYERYHMQEETPVQLSGEFILTEEGNVYYLQIDAASAYTKLEKVYDGGDVVAISASETAARCIGIKENGKAESWWINQDSLAVEDWEEAVAVCQGFYYAVALDGQGQVYYIDQNEEVTTSVSEALSTWSDIVEIAVLFETIVGMKADGSCLFLNIADYK